MAIKKVEIRPEGSNDYGDILYAKTSADQVIMDGGQTVEAQINNLGAYAVASGTNTYTATITGYTLVTGQTVRIKFTNANTSASTLNINGLGAKSIVKGNGSALSSGNIKAGQICNLVYGGSNFQLLGEGGEYGTAVASDVLASKTIGTDAGLVTGTMPSNGSQTATITTQGGTKVVPAGNTTGGTITASFANLSAGNVKSGVNIGGVVGTVAEAEVFLLDSLITYDHDQINTMVNESFINGGTTNHVLFHVYKASSTPTASFSISGTEEFSWHMASSYSTPGTNTNGIGKTLSIPNISNNKGALIYNPKRGTITFNGAVSSSGRLNIFIP